MDRILCHQGVSYIPDMFRTKLISRHYYNRLVDHFGIKKTSELISQKYNKPILRANVKSYVKGYNIYLASKSVKYEYYGNVQFFLVLTHP